MNIAFRGLGANIQDAQNLQKIVIRCHVTLNFFYNGFKLASTVVRPLPSPIVILFATL